MYTCSLERMTDKIKTFSQFGDAGHGGITRYSLSPEAIMARNEFRKRMEASVQPLRLMMWQICMQHFREQIRMQSGSSWLLIVIP